MIRSRRGTQVLLGALCALAAAAAAQPAPTAPKDATATTRALHAKALAELPFSDQQDFADARRGFVAALPDEVIRASDGRAVFDLTRYYFIRDREEAPVTVNPSLWRQERLVVTAGLFKVQDGIYQVRGYDLSNMTIIEGDEGIILYDVMTSAETAKAALDLYYANRPRKPVVAVLYSHSHADHFAGVRGVVSAADVAAG